MNIKENDKMNISNTETPLAKEVKKHIRKLIKPLKDEDKLKKILKTKLTKKEFKILNAWANNEDIKPILKKLYIDKDRYDELASKLIKKLNQEKIKQEIMI